MLTFDRRKDHKWIFQKNISSANLMEAYLEVLKETSNTIDFDEMQRSLKVKDLYKGRSSSGNVNTFG